VTLLPYVMYPVSVIHGEEVPSVCDMLGDFSRRDDMWEL